MNSDDFLDYYNKIDSYLKKSNNCETYESFSHKVNSSSNNIVQRSKGELISLGELRNAIVHNPKINGKVIAEPHEETVIRIKELYETIINPKKVYPEFQSEVLGAKEDDFINDIIFKMREKSFSQFPIFNQENNIIEIINTNTISRWLSLKLEENGTILIDNVKVRDLIPEIEFKANYHFISRNASIYDAFDLFTKEIHSKHRNLDLLFITNSGKPTEKILGLITIEDIASKI